MPRDGFQVFDADAHVIEPFDLWQKYLPARFRDRAPVIEDQRGFGVTVDGIAINTIAKRKGHLTAEQRQAEAAGGSTRPPRDYLAQPSGFSGAGFLLDFDRIGIDRAVLFPSAGMFATADERVDPDLAVEIACGYNNWFVDFRQADPDRLRGAALVPQRHLAAACAEVERAAGLGFRAIYVRPNPYLGRNLNDPAYEPLYATVEATGLPLIVHEAAKPNLPQISADRFPNSHMRHMCEHPMEQMIACMSVTFGGVLERHPDLRVGFVESGCGWLPYWLERMDAHYAQSCLPVVNFDRPALSMPPSEYFQRQCFISVDAAEAVVPCIIELHGDQSLVWSSDYPHGDGHYPDAVDLFLATPKLSDEAKRHILWDNPNRLYESRKS
jgi:predicted TIM-barrel fold metal-dependent hydrolase